MNRESNVKNRKRSMCVHFFCSVRKKENKKTTHKHLVSNDRICCSIGDFNLDSFRLTRDSLEYYLTLQSESHRDTWNNVLILLLTKILRLNDERV